MEIHGNLIDIHIDEIYPATLMISNGKIIKIIRLNHAVSGYILPGLIDAHVHIESSMLIPIEFAREAIKKGVVAVVTDPHEIANVLGKDGVSLMLANSKGVPFKFYYGAPSCVPATPFESNGGKIEVADIEDMILKKEVNFLSEMMNFPGVIHGDASVMEKIKVARKHKLPVDGHAPGLLGKDLDKYIRAGISTDHECINIEEAREKILKGMKILIREGSAAKNFEALIDLIDDYPDKIMFCSDDIHPDDLQNSYMLDFIKRGLKKNKNIFDLIRCCTMIPREHYGLSTGCAGEGEVADLIVVDSIENLNVTATYVDGEKIFADDKLYFPSSSFESVDVMKCKKLEPENIKVEFSNKKVNIIGVEENQIITSKIEKFYPSMEDINRDKLNKIVVFNRYDRNQKPAVGFIKGFKTGNIAIAQTIAHDSHNIIAIGNDDKLLIKAINEIISLKGGIVACNSKTSMDLYLDFGGLMSSSSLGKVAGKYAKLKDFARENGCKIKEPFMTLSFMALLVIPSLKISDKGLFDVTQFDFIDLFEN